MTKHKQLGDMEKKHIVGAYQTATLSHFDGTGRKVYYTDIEKPFTQGRIISLTDPDGYITHANTAFVEMSGYSKDELMGTPHHILRHPHMPKVAFEGLWQSLKSEGEWQGYVKNLRKDGGYYWVFASVFSLLRGGKLVGYTSTRGPVPPHKIQSYSQLYQKMLAEEEQQ